MLQIIDGRTLKIYNTTACKTTL